MESSFVVSASGGIVYNHLDALGSVIATSSNGAVASQTGYDPTGNTTQVAGPFGYAGGRSDYGIGYVHFGARDYNPGLGRFISPDPIGYAGGNSLYAYAAADPLNVVDPSGLYGLFVSGGITAVGGSGGSGTASVTVNQATTPIAQVNGAIATAQVGGGAFYSAGRGASLGIFGTAQAALTGLLPNGSTIVASALPSDPNSQNGALGASLGIGKGLGITNARNVSDLSGIAHVNQLDLGIVSLQLSRGRADDGKFIWSLSVGGTVGLGLSSFDTQSRTISIDHSRS